MDLESEKGRSLWCILLTAEEVLQTGVCHCAISHLVLTGQVLQTLNGGLHSGHSEEGGQIGSVSGHYDETEEPPERAQYSPTRSHRSSISPCSAQANHNDPDRY